MRSTPSHASPQYEGRPRGGPFRFIGRWSASLALVALVACASGGSGERAGAPGAEIVARPLDLYRELGFLTGSAQFPAVASISTMAGPADSTFVLIGMSLPNNALRFQRDAGGFFAEYAVEITIMDRDSVTLRRLSTTDTVRIPAFAETGRSDESVVFQQAVALLPGSYLIRLHASDGNSARGFRTIDSLVVPTYGDGTLATPVLVHRADGRVSRGEVPNLIVNPRRTVPYGGDVPLLYLEAYGAEVPVDVRVVNDDGAVLWQARARLGRGGDGLHHDVLPIPAETLPLGRFWIEVERSGRAVHRSPLVLTISDQWMVANFDDVLQFLRYIAHPEEIDSLRSGSAAERRERWEQFWARRNPLPQTPVNEYREQFFQRVRHATEAFREPGSAGWATDRGEVFIVLGSPDHVVERFIGRPDITGRANAEEWVYTTGPAGRLNLLFHDRSGFGRLELVPSSSAAFRAAADRLKPRRR
jgi:GWxTD domain-containing protein